MILKPLFLRQGFLVVQPGCVRKFYAPHALGISLTELLMESICFWAVFAEDYRRGLEGIDLIKSTIR
jgi:hypothetical protein